MFKGMEVFHNPVAPLSSTLLAGCFKTAGLYSKWNSGDIGFSPLSSLEDLGVNGNHSGGVLSRWFSTGFDSPGSFGWQGFGATHFSWIRWWLLVSALVHLVAQWWCPFQQTMRMEASAHSLSRWSAFKLVCG